MVIDLCGQNGALPKDDTGKVRRPCHALDSCEHDMCRVSMALISWHNAVCLHAQTLATCTNSGSTWVDEVVTKQLKAVLAR